MLEAVSRSRSRLSANGVFQSTLKGFTAISLSPSLQRKMEFLDEETRPRIQFQSRFSPASNSQSETLKINKPLAITCVFISSIIFVLSILFLESKLIQFLLFWLSISLSVGPFAPISVTGGDIRVGQGELLESSSDLDQEVQNDDSNKRVPNRRQKVRKSEEPNLIAPVFGTVRNVEKSEPKSVNSVNGSVIHEEKEWTDEDFELLKKQLSKHPVGEPKRWEKIAEGFSGRHGLESVIKMAKSMPERKPGNGDSFSQFLKQRKPLDKRIEEVDADLGDVSDNKKESNWSAGEDIALLNALKAFPKDTAMRWEKIEAAVPGKTKACCMKRVAELKKGFRTSKAPGDS